MNTIELLKTDHRKAEKLFDRILKPRSKRKTKRKLFDELKDALTLHSKTEEKFIYPLMEKKPESHDLTMEANEEHHMIKILLTEIPMTMDNDVWDAKITTLYEQFKHHIKEEEHELFPMFQKHVGKTELMDIDGQVKIWRNEYHAEDSPGIISRLVQQFGLSSN